VGRHLRYEFAAFLALIQSKIYSSQLLLPVAAGAGFDVLGQEFPNLSLVLIAMLIAVAIGVRLGMFVVQRKTLRNLVLGIASVFQTLPSLALSGFLIPIPFIGGIGRLSRDHAKSEASANHHLAE
jgi:ABC-type proline/glycine betaine transport system permease subunit